MKNVIIAAAALFIAGATVPASAASFVTGGAVDRALSWEYGADYERLGGIRVRQLLQDDD